MQRPVYKRIVLKVSGESLSGNNGYGIDAAMISSIAEQVKEVVELTLRLQSSVAVVTSGAVLLEVQKGLTGQQPIIWVCSRQ